MIFTYQRYVNVQMDTGGRPATHMRFDAASAYCDGDSLVLAFAGTTEAETISEARERVFSIHNHDDRPDGQVAPSMSVGDVVVLGVDAPDVAQAAVESYTLAFACERTGWSAVRVPTNIDPRPWIEVMEAQDRRQA